jgi:predicted amino acid racemase
MSYPKLTIDYTKIKANAKIILSLCKKRDLSVTGVIKGLSGDVKLANILHTAGYSHIASSRISQLKNIKPFLPLSDLMLIRTPMLSELDDVIDYSGISLHSEKRVLKELNNKCIKKKVFHKIILMYDVGDLREGILNEDELLALAKYVEFELENVHLYGVGINLTCYGTVVPSLSNAKKLSLVAKSIESVIGRKLEIISGGSTTSLPLIAKTPLPDKINNLRIGAAIIAPIELPLLWGITIEGLYNDAITIEGEIIEINSKPTVPIGELNVDGFGKRRNFADKGIRKRAIVAIGNADVGDCTNLVPKDNHTYVLGASSDHLLLDIEDCDLDYSIGDTIKFFMHYQNILFSMNQPDVTKIHIN